MLAPRPRGRRSVAAHDNREPEQLPGGGWTSSSVWLVTGSTESRWAADRAVGNAVPQEILCLAQLVVRLPVHGELNLVLFRGERFDLHAWFLDRGLNGRQFRGCAHGEWGGDHQTGTRRRRCFRHGQLPDRGRHGRLRP